MNKKIVDRAQSMARDKTNGMKLRKYWHSIKSNPYRPNLGTARKGSLHVDWHNAFVDECKRIGRSVK